jgi:hypothetical protein
MEPAGMDADVVVTANFALVEQPATIRMAIKAEIPMARDTTPRLNRTLFDIAAIPFGVDGAPVVKP